MDPALESIVNSNEPPTEAQAQGLRHLLASTVSHLDAIDATILASSLPSEFAHRRRRCGEFVAALTGALSLMRTIPAEILSEIFLICRDQNLEYSNYSIAAKANAPFIFTLVSSRWRMICLSDPRLWDHIYLTQCTPMPPPQYIKQLMARSDRLPLNVRLMISSEKASHRSWRPESPYQIVDVLLDGHARLQHMELSVGSSEIMPAFWRRNRMFPLLASLTIVIDGPAGVGSPFGLGIFHTAPSLRHLDILSLNSPFDSRASAVTWSQLRELDLRIRIGLFEARNILAECSRVEKFSISLFPTRGYVQLPGRITRLVNLRHLCVHLEQEGEIQLDPIPFFAAFSFPNLRYLFIWARGLSPDFLPDLYHRSAFQLEELVLLNLELSARDLIPFLRLVPSLQIIYLAAHGFDDEYFRAFTYDPNSPSSLELPHLRSLSFEDSEFDIGYIHTNGISVAEMAESVAKYSGSHNAAFPALEELILHCDMSGPKFKSDIEDRLRSASSTGVVKYERN
ncbi:hypothetical protein B0H11DRAFT_1916909 [Mycena galericulata]|nr:hypothetical protein B0H11DRAFT_1916909 [Mycena galericulata]